MKTAIAILCVLILLVAAGYTVIMCTPPNLLTIGFHQNPGWFHRARFTKVVEQVRALKLPPGEEIRLRLEDLSDPNSLRPVDANETPVRGQGAGDVWARVTPSGNLKVVIETKDLGHAGEYGFAYSDLPLSPTPIGEGWFELDVPGHLRLVTPRMQIDDHWWEVLYNLD